MNTWVRVGLMAVLVAVLFALAGSNVAVVLGAAGVVLLVIGLAVGGWRSRVQ
jgi:uncharacterized membrane protein YqjE